MRITSRWHAVLGLVILWTALCLAAAPVAVAAGATFTSHVPAVGATVAPPTALTVRVDADSLVTGGSFVVNGVTRVASVNYPVGHEEEFYDPDWDEYYSAWVVDDYTVADLTCTPPVLSPGSHNATATVTTASSGSSTGSWSFTVDQAPSVSAIAPANASSVATLTPTISATITDDDAAFAATMIFDGSPVVPLYDSATKTFTYTPALPLADWSNHVVSLMVSDPHGITTVRSWSFQTHWAPKLTVPVPANNSLATIARPVIGLTTADSVAGPLQMRLVLDGAEVFAGSVPQGAWAWTPSIDLAVGAHTVSAEVTDADGNTTPLSWTFQVVPPAVFSAMTPSPGSTVAPPGAVSVRVDADSDLTSANFVVGGVARSASISYPIGHLEEYYDSEWDEYWYEWVTDDFTVADVSCVPPVLASGTQTATVTVNTVSSGTSTQSWSFLVDQAPSVSAFYPAAGSSVGTLTPTITATVTDNDTEFSTTMLVDGVPVVPVYDAGTKTYSYTPAIPYADWTNHSVSVTVTDAHGLSTTRAWTFVVHVAPKLVSAVPADGTNVTIPRPPIGVTVTDGVAGSLQARLELDGTQVFAGPVAQGAWTWTPSVDLAPGDHTAVAEVTDVDGNVTTENWAFRIVSPAVFSAPTPGPGTTVAPPTSMSVRVDAESTVTAGSYVIDGVVRPATIDYPVGHWEIVGFDEEWWEDIWGWIPDDYTVANISCVPQTLAPGSHNAVVSATTAGSGTSTYGWSFLVDTAPVISAITPSNGAKVATLTPTITARVTDNDTTFTETMLVDNVPVVPVFNPATKTYSYTPQVPFADWSTHSVSITVTDAHGISVTRAWSFQVHVAPKLTNPVPTNGATASTPRSPIGLTTLDNVGGTLQMRLILDGATVFTGPVAQGVWTWTPPSDLVIRTHNVRAEVTDANGNTTALQWTFAPPAMTTPACGECHVGYPTPNHPIGDCESCHGGDHGEGDDCGGCHGSHSASYLINRCNWCHDHSTAENTAAHASTSTTGCSECHESSLTIEHSRYPAGSTKYGCSVCHTSTDPQVRSAIANNLTNCDACHDLSSSHESAHGQGFAGETCSGEGCHVADVVLEHDGDCTGCHGSTTPAVVAAISAGDASCGACHEVTEGHVSLHDTSDTASALIGVFSQNHEGQGPTGLVVACSNCHEPNLAAVHGSECQVCHKPGGPRDSFEAWDGTCQQGACHPTLHADANVAHTAIDRSRCDVCHEADMSVTPADCASCHAASETVPPVTASDAKTSYVGGARIVLTASDAKPTSGMHRTYYRLDGGPQTSGTIVTVTGPASGVETHEVEFWSEDNSGNVDTPHRTASFTIAADTDAPVTTSDATATYFGPTTVRLSVVDNGSIPVLGTYYRLDGGPQVAGAIIQVPQPDSGSQSHTIEFWSVDGTGNVETPHKTAGFTVTADRAAPVTTSDAPAYDRTSGSLLVKLTATDAMPGSGVAQIYRRVNGGPATASAYATISGARVHTIEFWSVDGAGNEELPHKTATVTKDWWAPTTGSDVKASYTNAAVLHLTPVDAGPAGVAATYHRVNGGPPSTGTSLTVTSNGTNTIQYWSEDKAGNVEGVKTATFTISGSGADTTPPSTTSDAVSSYGSDAVIRLTANDGGGSGVAATYYKVDGGAQSVGVTITVAAPASGSANHTIEFWSVDNSGNQESPHKTANFSIAASNGTVTFRWDGPPDGAWADFYVDGVLVGERAMPGWNGQFSVTLPVRSTPYALKAYWWDPDNEADPMWSYGSALVNTPGKAVTWYY